jgi:hypothetical protein
MFFFYVFSAIPCLPWLLSFLLLLFVSFLGSTIIVCLHFLAHIFPVCLFCLQFLFHFLRELFTVDSYSVVRRSFPFSLGEFSALFVF